MVYPPEENEGFEAFGNSYALLDIGNEERLESFGGIRVRRQAPACTEAPQRSPDDWRTALAWNRNEASWIGTPPDDWHMSWGDHRFTLRPTGSSQVGLFPEQAPNWLWIEQQLARQARPLRILNAFAYTGGSTLAASTSQTEVVHLDGAKPAVQWARRNAEASRKDGNTIRWIVEDVMRFLSREIRRGNRYDALILDPPAFGRGNSGGRWKLTRDLSALLQATAELLSDDPAFVLLSCHPTGWQERDLLHAVKSILWPGAASFCPYSLRIPSQTLGLALPLGLACRITW